MPRKKKEEQLPIEETFNYGGLVSFIVLCSLVVFSIGKLGLVGIIINNIFSFLVGPSYLIILISLLFITFFNVFLKKKYHLNFWFYIGIIILNVAVVLLTSHLIYGNLESINFENVLSILKNITSIADKEASFDGGLIGSLLIFLSYEAFAKEGTIIVLVVMFALAAILIVPLGFYKSAINTVKDNSVKAVDSLKEKRDIKIEQRKLEKEKLEQEKLKKTQAEEERKLELARQMSEAFVDTPDPEPTIYEEVPIENIENKSEFSKTFFIDDEVSKTSKKTKSNTATKSEQKEDKNEIKKVRRKTGAYHLAPISLLDKANGKPSNLNKTSADIKGKQLIDTLAIFDIDVELVNTHIGPSVTKFEVKPDANIKVNRINNIQDNIKMALAVKTIRIEAPIPGRNAVGIEIPNAEPVPVKLFELMKEVPIKYRSSNLMFALGKDLMGKPVYCELNKMPHLLIAGATGSGKSVCINTIITSYLLRTNPDDLKLVLIDPKKVEFTPYHDIPHLLWPVITDANVASLMLKKAVVIMGDRYDKFADAGVRDIASFNDLVERHNTNLKTGETPMTRLPHIVIIIDELADLMSVAKKDVEMSIQRLTQLSRACGMHMIVATQRPSTDVITGLIKSNIPSRISFAVSSSIDSRTIIDSVGAEKLLGYGDMLYKPQDENAPIRIQGAFVSDKEISNITSFVKKEASPEYEDSYFELMRNENSSAAFAYTAEGGNSKDSLYDEVVEYVKEAQKASTSLLQRKFGIGYNRSARIIDQLEENGVIGPANGSKPREVYLKKDENDV